MAKLIYVPIEPYKGRYSEQWIRWFESEFKQYGIDYLTVLGESLSTEVQTGSVFNPVSISHYRAVQLARIHRLVFEGKVSNGDVIFFDDFQFPGMEQIAHYLPQIGLQVDIFSFCHAGTWDKADYVNRFGLSRWMRFEEQAWFEINKKVFVATEFHKQLIVQQFPQYESKLSVVGEPFNTKEVTGNRKLIPFSKRKVDLIFPHRVDEEKNPVMFLKAVECTSRRIGKSLTVRIPITERLTKEQYYDLLNNSKLVVSTAFQETFGIAVAEAVTLGCIPVLPDCLSYRDIYPPEYRYVPYNLEECVNLIIRFLSITDEEWNFRYKHLSKIVSRFDYTIFRILTEIGLL